MARLRRRLFTRLLWWVMVLTLLVTLPFRWLPPPVTSFMVQARLLGLGGEKPCPAIFREWVAWEDINPTAPLAAIAAEDQRFPSHWGLDVDAIAAALEERQSGGRLRGASTITQQLAKNLYLWPGQSWLRKILEAGLTLVLEGTWPKRRILEVYLNSVQFGRCTFGVEAASRRFFNKPSALLSDREAASLAAVLPNPVRLAVNRSDSYMNGRIEWILGQMRALGGSDYLRRL